MALISDTLLENNNAAMGNEYVRSDDKSYISQINFHARTLRQQIGSLRQASRLDYTPRTTTNPIPAGYREIFERADHSQMDILLVCIVIQIAVVSRLIGNDVLAFGYAVFNYSKLYPTIERKIIHSRRYKIILTMNIMRENFCTRPS